ncbi:MAG: 2Fe-2S iron-sulfur cluster-binding protein [Pseudomonadota bacterium]|nr:2Fe-2S iron-sulfur cluster-binding protein [Pseudomonadota bacterium]
MEFVDLGQVVEAGLGMTLLEVCDAFGLPMETACGGFAACNSCRVRVIAGALSEVEDVEHPFLDDDGQRLGCQARVVGAVTVRLEPGA